jgi:UDP-N-acetylmuramoylalanine--D-glutamate ligase
MYQTLIEYLDARRILLLGYGREGQSSHRFIREHLPQKSIGIADVRALQTDDPLVMLHTGERYLDAMGDYDLILQSPGISLRDVRVRMVRKLAARRICFYASRRVKKSALPAQKGKPRLRI